MKKPNVYLTALTVAVALTALSRLQQPPTTAAAPEGALAVAKQVKPAATPEPLERPQPKRFSADCADAVSEPLQHLQSADAAFTLQEIYALGCELSEADRLALYEWIRITATDEETLYLKDEVLNQLERQRPFPEEYAEQLADMALDQLLDADLRGYILQHLRLNYGRFSEFEQAFVLDTYYQTLKESHNDAGGTALINLTECAQAGQRVDLSVLRAAAYTQAFEQRTSTGNRVTAMQCAVELGVEGMTEQLKAVIESEDEPLGVKLSAVAALAATDGRAQKTYLHKLIGSGHGLYKQAVEHNLKIVE